MRTTFRIDGDLLDQLKARAARERVPVSRLVNRVLRAGLNDRCQSDVADAGDFEAETFAMGHPIIDVTHAGALAAMIEDDETRRRLIPGS